MQGNQPVSRGVVAAAVGAIALALTGVVIVATNIGTSADEMIGSGSQSLPRASVHVKGLHHGKARYGKHLHIRVKNGALSAVTVNQKGAGTLAGSFNQTHTRWHSSSPLAPSTQVKAAISYVDLAHQAQVRHLAMRTRAAKNKFNAFLSPGSGTVGIGSPIVVNFDRFVPAKKRAEVQSGLAVTTKPSVVGAWHWMSGESVHWRPPHYWHPGTKVHVSSDLQGVDIGHQTYGPVGMHKVSFKIGDAHISEADQAAHVMRVYNNGNLIRTFPISTGRSEYPTMDGVHIALGKSQTVEMNSATVGIPKGSPGYYDEIVYWDVRISNGGEFVHAAPWSVGSQGSSNVSHGCVNLSTENATWFYNWSTFGDIVDVYNGVRPPELGDAGTADWNMSWKKWVAGDAAPTKAAKHAHARAARTYEPGFRPAKPKHHHKHSAHAHHRRHHHSGQSSASSGSTY
jgi:lipoprotein-anchoring transpeptidase ErfK/SrfK